MNFPPPHVATLPRSQLYTLSLSIADIEDDGEGVPVLIRQYLKIGGRLLGFNVDPSFSDALDVLIAKAVLA
jgi:hypothetical protein